MVKYLSQTEAQQIDEELMGERGAYTLEQLMELAGLSVAQAIARSYPPSTHPRALVACGPGNQGGDGLVAARHLALFGYKPTLFYPKPGRNGHYQKLLSQCSNFQIPTLPADADIPSALSSTDLVVDSIFGFSFSGAPRAPFDTVISALKERSSDGSLPIVSVDIPSAWDVEKGNVDERSFEPAALVSLTAPKLGAKEFRGIHWLGGRFVPGWLEEKYQLNLPEYPDGEQVVELPAGVANL